MSAQISTWTWTKKLLVQNKIKEIKIFTSENKEIKSLQTHYFVNDSGLISRQIDLTYDENKLDTFCIYYFVFDSLNRKSKYILTQKGKTSIANYFYPDSNTTTIKYDDDGKLSESIEKHFVRRHKEIWKIYYNGKHTLTGKKRVLQTTKKYTEHLKHPRSFTRVTDYFDSKNNISKTIYIYFRYNKFSLTKETITMIYNNQNELIKTCKISNKHQTPFFEYYECIKK